MDVDGLKMEPGADRDSTRASTGTGSGKGISKRQPKETKPKPNATPSGTRFQCPRCPKNFSRIENLTRHQANHDDVGKFACVVCRKRFTRSDLLNRHRRIHDNQAEPSKSHGPEYESSASTSQPEEYSKPVHRDDSHSSSQEGSGLSGGSSQNAFQGPVQHQALYMNRNQDAYQQMLLQDSHHGTGPPPQNRPQSQGLTSLMEAALAPQEAFQFQPVENINPMMWDGFMLFNDNSHSFMGSYDADISWTLNAFQPDSSPDYFMDEDMADAFAQVAYQQSPPQPIQHIPPYEHHAIDAVDAEDEDTTDWPDKVSRPGTPRIRAPRIVPLQLLPVSWQPVIDEARLSGLSASTIRPYQQISDRLRLSLLDALNGPAYGRSEMSRPEIGDALFPPWEVLDYFLRLYIRYIQPRFPVFHLPTFDIYGAPPLLLIAMMFLGSSHSSVDKGRFCRVFHQHLRIAALRLHETDPAYLRLTENNLTFFLLCLAGTWSGSKVLFAFAEASRGIIATACRRGRLLDCRPAAKIPTTGFQAPGISPMQSEWLAWVETEKRKRLGLSFLIFDSQYPALFNNQPYISKAETTNCVFPCPEEYWDAPSAESWKMLVGPADMPPSSYYLHALNCCLLRKWVKPSPPIAKTDEFGKIVLMYSILTQIFEWRQATSMLNPTGLMGTFGNMVHDMGKGLKERRRWLLDALDSFEECYMAPAISPASRLLHHLGYISLDVSLSDMHLAAGRSIIKRDEDFALENLRSWANSEISDRTMTHIFRMLEICYKLIESGMQGDSSYEITVCLFTGGIVCWAYARLRTGVVGTTIKEEYMAQVKRAAESLMKMGCWRMGQVFGRILMGFEGGGEKGKGKGNGI